MKEKSIFFIQRKKKKKSETNERKMFNLMNGKYKN